MLQLVRFKATETAIIGKMYLNGAFVCYTLENKKCAIMCGVYTIENSKSPKFGRELPLLYNGDCPASRGIRIHCGNVPKDSQGCVLVGMGIIQCQLKESKVAENMVVAICRNQTQMIVSET